MFRALSVTRALALVTEVLAYTQLPLASGTLGTTGSLGKDWVLVKEVNTTEVGTRNLAKLRTPEQKPSCSGPANHQRRVANLYTPNSKAADFLCIVFLRHILSIIVGPIPKP